MSAGRAVGLLLGVAADGVVGVTGQGRELTRLAQFSTLLDARHPGRLPALGCTGAALLAGIVVERAGRRSPVLQAAGTAVTTWAVLGAAGLATSGTALARELEDGDLESARLRLAGLGPLDTDGLDPRTLSRAAVETVAGNTSAVVVAPLVWGALAGVPGLIGARLLATLRAGARSGGYRRVTDLADRIGRLLPSRIAAGLTVLGAPVVGGSAEGAWRAWRRDLVAHPSPNTGRVQAAFAGALEVRLGGRTPYPSGVRERPVLGDGRNPDTGHVTRAVELSRVVGWLAGLTAAVLAAGAGRPAARLRRRRREDR